MHTKNSTRQKFKELILHANQQEAEDMNYQQNLAEWDATLTDGLEE